MSRLTRDGTAEPVSRDQILRHAREQGNVHFPCSADHEQDWQPYLVDPYSAICDDHTYIHTYIQDAENVAQEIRQIAVNIRDTPVSTQRPRHGVHRRGCPTPLQIAQRDDRHGPTDHPRAQGTVERLGGGGWFHETLMELCKS